MLDRIAATLPTLSASEQRVAKLVLADPRLFTQLAVGELANRAFVSKPTVVRFCRSVGYDGLLDFKRKLAGSVSEGVPFVHRSVDIDDKLEDIQVKVVDNAVAALLKYRNVSSAQTMEKALQAILNTQRSGGRVEFYGVGNSGIVAQDAQHKFFRLGVTSIAYSDGHMQIMSASTLGPQDCLILFSNSGRTRDLIDAAQIAQSRGATTIAITASASALSRLVDIHLPADHPESYDRYSPMVSRLLHLLILDVLVTAVALKIGEPLQQKLYAMKESLKSKRYLEDGE